MALLSNVARIAGQRSMHVYGFTHLCRKYQVSYGQPEDFFALPSVLREHPDFRSSVSRFAAAAMSGDQPLSLNEVAVALAVALGGLQMAAHQQLDVPDEFMTMLRSSFAPGAGEIAVEQGALAPVSTSPPSQLPPALPFAPSRSAAPQSASDVFRPPPILGQALRAEVPEYELAQEAAPVRPATRAAGPELVAKVRHLLLRAKGPTATNAGGRRASHRDDSGAGRPRRTRVDRGAPGISGASRAQDSN